MSGTTIKLRKAERRQLRWTSRSYGLPFREVLRARIILVLEQDPCVSRAASELGVDVNNSASAFPLNPAANN